MRPVLRAAGTALVAVLAAGCAQDTTQGTGGSQGHASPSPHAGTTAPAAATSSPSPTPSASATPTPTAGSTVMPLPATDPYVRLAGALHERGVAVWWEADLVGSWLAGRRAFDEDVTRLGQLAASVPTAGFKVADELGYQDGLTTPAQVSGFLRAARAALARVAPGRPLLVDAVVPSLGCLPWRGGTAERGCADQYDAKYPGLTLRAVTGYLREGLIDRLDLSSGLLDPSTYAGWALSLDQAQRDAWRHVRSLGWDRLTTLQSRKALAEPGGYRGGRSQAAADARVYLQLPVAAGAKAVDVWTWRQQYDGATVGLLAPSLAPNPLWQELIRARAQGVHLATHMTPSTLPTGAAALATQCDRVAEVFDAVFVAAGTG